MADAFLDSKNSEKWNDLIEVIRRLRAPEGCPWDREQTHRSLAKYAIEEVYELVEAIESGSDENLVEELGDVLLQVVLHAQIASETSRFSVHDVIGRLTEKMIRRHPHVFGEKNTSSDNATLTTDQVLDRWQTLKSEEKASKSIFSFEIPKGLPALSRSAKIGEKTKHLRFDWPGWQGVLTKVEEELDEVKKALKENPSPLYDALTEPNLGPSRDQVSCEIGDLLFSVAQLARHRGLDPEQSLRDANQRFERRFGILRVLAEKKSAADGRNWESRSQDELEELWQVAKVEELKL